MLRAGLNLALINLYLYTMLGLYTVTKHSTSRGWQPLVLALGAGVLLLASSWPVWAAEPAPESQASSTQSAIQNATQTRTTVERGLEIFQEADRRQSGFVDMLVDLKMILRNRKGNAVSRDLELRQLEVPDGGDKLMVVFNTPKAIAGTALLSHGQITREDDQWLYLPALKRVKKIASRNRSGPFLGSEFSYEDLSTQEVEKYTYNYLREEACGDQNCFVVERRPGPNLYSGYLRQVFWLDTEHYRTQKVDYYNRGDRLTKTLVGSDFVVFDVPAVDPASGSAKIWKAGRMLMTNHVTKKSTELTWDAYRFGVGLSAERDLSVTSLRRVR